MPRLVTSIIPGGQALFLMSLLCQHLRRKRRSANNHSSDAQKLRSFRLLNFCAERVVTFPECLSGSIFSDCWNKAQETRLDRIQAIRDDPIRCIESEEGQLFIVGQMGQFGETTRKVGPAESECLRSPHVSIEPNSTRSLFDRKSRVRDPLIVLMHSEFNDALTIGETSKVLSPVETRN